MQAGGAQYFILFWYYIRIYTVVTFTRVNLDGEKGKK